MVSILWYHWSHTRNGWVREAFVYIKQRKLRWDVKTGVQRKSGIGDGPDQTLDQSSSRTEAN